MRRGTLALSWGRYGGFYLHRRRVCLGWVALTLIPHVEVEDLMRAYIDQDGSTSACNCASVGLVEHWRHGLGCPYGNAARVGGTG